MTDLTTLLRDLSEKAGKAAPGPWKHVTCEDGLEMVCTEGDTVCFGDANHQAPPTAAETCQYLAACPPALIQALVEVSVAASDHYACHPDNTTHALIEALRRLEAVAQEMGK